MTSAVGISVARQPLRAHRHIARLEPQSLGMGPDAVNQTGSIDPRSPRRGVCSVVPARYPLTHGTAHQRYVCAWRAHNRGRTVRRSLATTRFDRCIDSPRTGVHRKCTMHGMHHLLVGCRPPSTNACGPTMLFSPRPSFRFALHARRTSVIMLSEQTSTQVLTTVLSAPHHDLC